MFMKLLKTQFEPQDIRTLQALKQAIEEQRKRLRNLQQAVSVHEHRLMDYVDAGGTISGFLLEVVTQERRYSTYRDALLMYGGSELVARALKECPPTISRKLVFEEQDDE